MWRGSSRRSPDYWLVGMLGQEGGQVVIGWVITLWGLIGCFLGFAALRLLVVRGTLAVLWCLVVQLVKSPVAVEKVNAWTDLVRAGEVLLSFFSCFALGGESLWCYRWA